MSIESEEQVPGYFASPEAAVPLITGLLEKRRFRELAAYYDLTGSGIDRAGLESGAYFLRQQRPPSAHPAGFWRYRHPFAPGFRYSHITPGSKAGVYIIHLKIIIEQGAGIPPQVGLSSFAMIRSERGWQILPGEPVEAADMTPDVHDSDTASGR